MTDAIWAEHDAYKAALPRQPLWEQPPPQRLTGKKGWRWWHRSQRHHTRDRYDLMCFPAGWECLECDLLVGKM